MTMPLWDTIEPTLKRTVENSIVAAPAGMLAGGLFARPGQRAESSARTGARAVGATAGATMADSLAAHGLNYLHHNTTLGAPWWLGIPGRIGSLIAGAYLGDRLALKALGNPSWQVDAGRL